MYQLFEQLTKEFHNAFVFYENREQKSCEIVTPIVLNKIKFSLHIEEISSLGEIIYVVHDNGWILNGEYGECVDNYKYWIIAYNLNLKNDLIYKEGKYEEILLNCRLLVNLAIKIVK